MKKRLHTEFLLETEDAETFHKYYIKNSKQFQRTKWIASSIAPLILTAFLISDYYKGDSNILSNAIIYGILSIFSIYFIPRRIEKRALTTTKKMMEEGDNSELFGKLTFEFSEESLLVQSKNLRSNLLWNGITKQTKTKDYYYLFTSEACAYILPKSKLGFDEKEILDFENLLSRKIKAQA
ncbi:YcxB family protein [Leptospira koniambonensis]|uniref:YcxB family protein n=1 Tax=Leptospira koniambonensis TaxID=2484950 RepID=UPI003EB74ACE